MVKLRINETKEDRIADIKEMIADYNSQLNQLRPRTDEDFETDAVRFFRLASKGQIKSYLDFIFRPVSHSKYPEKGVLTSLDEVLRYESKIIEKYCLRLIQNPEFQKNLESNMSIAKVGALFLRELREEENAFYYLLDRKITERILNKTIYYDDMHPHRNEAYQNFRQIKQALKDVENEYEATGIGIFERLDRIEKERLKRIYAELEKREAASLEKLRKLKIEMYNIPVKELEEQPKLNNRITYKQCNDCGAWHNDQYNRCAPCNDFSAKNDR